MLKDIRLHINADENKQAEQEEALASLITANLSENINVFRRNIPTLLNYVEANESASISVFANKFGRPNIVDYGTGRVLYGLDPQKEIAEQVAEYQSRPVYIDLTDKELNEPDKEVLPQVHTIAELDSFKHWLNRTPLPETVNVMVVLGLGLGEHIQYLLEQVKINHLIIYEPEAQYFRCSVTATKWKRIFDLAKQNGTAFYFQLHKDGRDLVNDISELAGHFDFNGFYLYQHYHHVVFDSIVDQLTTHDWSSLKERGVSFKLNPSSEEYSPPWTPSVQLSEYQDVDRTCDRFQENLSAFEKYFPDVYQDFKDYGPKYWLPVHTANGDINLLRKSDLTPWYSDDIKHDCQVNLQGFVEHPHKDGLVLGYKGTKLKDYLHYRFVKQTEVLLDSLDEETGSLPSDVKSLIMFGLGAGYQLEALMEQHQVEKLFICEPNRDFFYASLFAIDWASILKKIDQRGWRLYVNIGDDGSNLFRDLLGQFYAIGPYVLANTYFYPCYYNSTLNEAIGHLREQLQVVISMGEYFDHARYGIAHTHFGLAHEFPHMKKEPSKALSYDDKEVPVFLVGNGPSLDASIAVLKECQDQAIIISCGTSLQVLHRNGIRPDFHAEIEQNRSTFDWASRVNDFDYLKSITLLSCNGVHPDTANLYKDVIIAFKEGESSTVSALNVLGEDKYAVLKFAFPTVTNFALNFFIEIGFSQVYLFGVDLGFRNSRNHHSKQSGYFDENGKQLYKYEDKNNTSIVIAANFGGTVFTKHEFKVAKMVMEQSLSASNVTCYNTSDGAKIAGSQSLPLESVFVATSDQDKIASLENLRKNCFITQPFQQFLNKWDEKYVPSILEKEMGIFGEKISRTELSFDAFDKLVEEQKKMLFASYQHGKSLLFYYFYGTVNFANVILSKMANARFSDEAEQVKALEQAKGIWLEAYRDIQHAILSGANEFDFCSSLTAHRIEKKFKSLGHGKTALVISDCPVMEANLIRLCGVYDIPCKAYLEGAQSTATSTDLLFVFSQYDEIEPQKLAATLQHVSFENAIYSSYKVIRNERCNELLAVSNRLSLMQGFGHLTKTGSLFGDHTVLNGDLMYAYRMFNFIFSSKIYSVFLAKLEIYDVSSDAVQQGPKEDYTSILSGDRNLEFFSHFSCLRDQYDPESGSEEDTLQNRGRWLYRRPLFDEIILSQVEKKHVVEIISKNFVAIDEELLEIQNKLIS